MPEICVDTSAPFTFRAQDNLKAALASAGNAVEDRLPVGGIELLADHLYPMSTKQVGRLIRSWEIDTPSKLFFNRWLGSMRRLAITAEALGCALGLELVEHEPVSTETPSLCINERAEATLDDSFGLVSITLREALGYNNPDVDDAEITNRTTLFSNVTSIKPRETQKLIQWLEDSRNREYRDASRSLPYKTQLRMAIMAQVIGFDLVTTLEPKLIM